MCENRQLAAWEEGGGIGGGLGGDACSFVPLFFGDGKLKGGSQGRLGGKGVGWDGPERLWSKGSCIETWGLALILS